MDNTFHTLIENLLANDLSLNKIYFSDNKITPPLYSYQVNFPRLEFVLCGEYHHTIEKNGETASINMQIGDMLYLAPNCWNKPDFQAESSVVSLLFGKKHIGFSLVSRKTGKHNAYDTQKDHVIMPNGYAIESILSALNTLNKEQHKSPMDQYLICALLTYTQTILKNPVEIKQKSLNTFQNICIYIQKNYQENIDRNSLATIFNLSPNHLSRIFRQDGHMKLADYINWVRLDRAKFMLRNYPLKLDEIAFRCGYNDVNYFCRIFKHKIGRTPTEYRLIK